MVTSRRSGFKTLYSGGPRLHVTECMLTQTLMDEHVMECGITRCSRDHQWDNVGVFMINGLKEQ